MRTISALTQSQMFSLFFIGTIAHTRAHKHVVEGFSSFFFCFYIFSFSFSFLFFFTVQFFPSFLCVFLRISTTIILHDYAFFRCDSPVVPLLPSFAPPEQRCPFYCCQIYAQLRCLSRCLWVFHVELKLFKKIILRFVVF